MPQQTPPPHSSDSATLTAAIVGQYLLSEQQILGGIPSILRRTPATIEGRQAAVPRMRRLVRQVVARLIYTSNDLVRQMITASISEGARDAEASVSKAVALTGARPAGGGSGGNRPPGRRYNAGSDDFFDFSMPHGERSANAIRADIESELADVRFRITRLPDDIYKHIAPHGAIGQVLDNGFTPDQAQAVAWRVFTSQGVTGFTDKSGRDWALSSYVEMAVRTAAARAYNASHLARMNAMGVHLFSVPDTGHPCPLCFPWQHAILSDGTPAPDGVRVDATIAQATAAGLFHPNCRHTLVPYFVGVTDLPRREPWTDEMAAAYALTQKQRRLELAVRKAKRSLAFAYEPATRKEAIADVHAAQSKVRQFVNANGLLRQSRREQLDLRDPSMKLPTPIR